MKRIFGNRKTAGHWVFAGVLALGLAGAKALWAAGDDAAATETGAAAATLSQAEQDAIAKAVDEKLAAPKGVKVEIHGFAELDLIGDDTQSFKEAVGNAAVAKAGTTAGDNGQMLASPRNSRLAFLATAPEMDGWKSKGYLELDFLGYDPAPNYAAPSTTAAPNNTEAAFYSQPGIRIRHAYVDAQKDGWDIMAGQFWTLFGFQADTMLGSMTPGLALPGELFQRTPQVRVSKSFGDDAKLQLSVAADRPEESGSMVPNFDGGIRFSLGSLKGRFALPTNPVNAVPFSIGLSGTLRNYAYGTAGSNVNLNQGAQGQAVAADAMIPVLPLDDQGDGPSLVLAGEWTAGTGDGDQLFGWTGGTAPLSAAANGINLDAGVAGFSGANFTLLDLQSWQGQLQFHLPKSCATFITAGYGETYSDNVGTVAGTYNDESVMFANVVHDFNPNVRAGVEYDRFDTHYIAGAGFDAVDHRVLVTSWYRF